MTELSHSEIFSLAAKLDGTIVISTSFKDFVRVIETEKFSVLHEFPITFDFGGKRMAVSANQPFCFAGRFSRTGLGGYDYRDGKEVWRFKPVSQFQHVASDRHTPFVFVTTERGSALLIDEVTGSLVEKLPRCSDIYMSAYAPWYLLESAREYVVQHPIGVSKFKIKPSSFGILNAAFSPSHVAVSEAGSFVRIFDLNLGIEVSRYEPIAGSHILDISWCEPLAEFVFVEWPYERGGDRVIKRYSLETREACRIGILPACSAQIFFKGGAKLFTTEGDLIDVISGSQTSKIKFPRAKKRS